jgi:hypothetical protein
MTLGGILENIVADALVVGATTIAAVVILATSRWRKHARLLRFVGCTPEHSLIVVFFSTLVIQPGGALDFRGIARTYAGPAVPESEYLLARTLSAALEAPTSHLLAQFLVRAMKFIPNRRIRCWLGPSEAAVQYELSPLQVPVRLPTAPTICLGSPGYNYASDFYLSNLNPLLTFGGGAQPDIRQPGGPQVSYAGDVGMLQRLRTPDGYPVYIAAGLGTNGTRGALQHLIADWQRLEKRFGDGEFALALGFPWFQDDPFGFRRPTELLALTR